MNFRGIVMLRPFGRPVLSEAEGLRIDFVKHLAGRHPHPRFLANARNDISNELLGHHTRGRGHWKRSGGDEHSEAAPGGNRVALPFGSSGSPHALKSERPLADRSVLIRGVCRGASSTKSL